ncbi:hypothetical protein OKA05_12765 [Luteolibacter arcticus]|uniref:Uncharacterized protein n=1 Tax=Luteolibacter arcticus TaxID=1581411 RepID=A0ABT3GIV1_9BACT|nr:hypothetical protein [Luteolibacter arcticus]MCW1923429.1 hypothetical protein [Luteolibacter arcticus]
MLSLLSLIGLPVIIAHWVGIMGLRRGRRGVAWVLMVVGMTINSLMLVLPFLYSLTGFQNLGWTGMAWVYIPYAISTLGSLLFATGFALHGLGSARATERQGDLEQLVAAMSEEIDRLKDERARP